MMILFLLALVISISFFPFHAYAAWTPLISAADFDGIKSDMLTAVAAIAGFILIIVGISYLVRVLR